MVSGGTGVVYYIMGVAMIYAGRLKGSIKKLEMEKKELKAMVFDMERGMKIGQMDKQIEADPNIIEADDKEASSIKPRKNIK
jgi:hypothetical protein